MSVGALSFNVVLEDYGFLTIDDFIVTGLGGNNSIQTVQPPPLNQPMLGTQPTSTAPPVTPPAAAAGTPSTGWGTGWFMSVYRAIHQLTAGGSASQTVSFECPSLDDADMNWGAYASIDGTTDPVTVTAQTFGASLYGRQFAVGDYVLWNDPKFISGVAVYEIDQITAVKFLGPATMQFTLKRAGLAPVGTTAVPGQAQFGSPMFAHSNVNFYRMIDALFVCNWNGANNSPQTFKLPWANMTVAAVVATMANLAPVTQSLFPQMFLQFATPPPPSPPPPFPTVGSILSVAPIVPKATGNQTLQQAPLNPQNTPPCPGLRTLRGNQYFNTQGEAMALGLAGDYWLPITGPESIRSVFGQLSVVSNTTGIQIAVLYKSADGTQCGLIDMLSWEVGEQYSYGELMGGNRPDQRRQMPYHNGWTPTNQGQLDYPPGILPSALGALDANGNIVSTWRGAVDPSTPVPFLEGGWWSFVVIACPTATPLPQVEVIVLQT
jgi:hypothetical protein